MISSDWRSQIFEKKKKIGNPNLDQTGQKRTLHEVFFHFLKFDSLVFLEIAYNDCLQQCLTSAGSKNHENFLDPNLGQRGQNRT